MPIKEKPRANGAIPSIVPWKDNPESKPIPDYVQALARSEFRPRYIVVRQPIGERFRRRAPSRIRAWRMPA